MKLTREWRVTEDKEWFGESYRHSYTWTPLDQQEIQALDRERERKLLATKRKLLESLGELRAIEGDSSVARIAELLLRK